LSLQHRSRGSALSYLVDLFKVKKYSDVRVLFTCNCLPFTSNFTSLLFKESTVTSIFRRHLSHRLDQTVILRRDVGLPSVASWSHRAAA